MSPQRNRIDPEKSKIKRKTNYTQKATTPGSGAILNRADAWHGAKSEHKIHDEPEYASISDNIIRTDVMKHKVMMMI